MAAPEPQLEGRVIAGNFRIERLLGRGAMGQVYLAEQISLGKKVAIKVLHRHLQGDEALAKRFQREAKAASSLNHPNSLQIIDFGQAQSGELFIAMELLSGRDLANVIHKEFPLPIERMVRIMTQVLAALDEAHAQNIIHRDLKPENIMIVDGRRERDFVKVCDFGIAKIQDAKSDGDSGTITMAGVVCGTPEYMSPEQCRGEKLDGRSDLYAAGVILYQMSTGQLPFTAESALGIVTKHLTETPVPPTQRAPQLAIDARLEQLILDAMQKDRERRPRTAFEMREKLETLLRGHTGSQRVPSEVARAATITTGSVPPAAPSPTLAGELVGSGELDAVPRRNGARVAGVALVLVGVAAGGFLVMRRSSSPQTQPAPVAAAQPQPAPKIEAPPPAPPPAPVETQPAAQPAPEKPTEPPPEKPRHEKKAARHEKKTVATGATNPKPVETTPAAEVPKPQGSPAQAAYKEGMALFDQGRPRDAIPKLQEAVHMDAGYADAYKALGRAFSRTGESDNAKKAYRRYLELRPNASDKVFIQSIIGDK
jgi:serine/threonine-protein kinase